MKKKEHKKKNIVIIIVIIIIILILPPVKKIQSNLIDSLIFPVKFMSYQTTKNIENSVSYMIYSKQIKSENTELQLQNQQLQLQNQQLQQQVSEFSQVKEAASIQQMYGSSAIVAKVSFVSESDIYSQFYIDAGTNQGVQVGMPVVEGKQLIGRIQEVDGDKSLVYPITREGFHVSVMDQDENNLGITSGKSDVLLTMMFTYTENQLKVGDTLVTSSISTVYPKGLLVGKVQNVKYSDGGELVQDLQINTGINPLKLDYVLVLKG